MASTQAKFAALGDQFGGLKDLKEANFAHFTSLLTALMRAQESKREDALIDDPYAEMLAGKEAIALASAISKMMQANAQGQNESWTEYVPFRTRFIDETLNARHDSITQVVILGAGLDTRAFRMESLRNCSVFEMDAGAAMQERKKKIFEENGIKPLTKDYHAIVADLAEYGWEQKLQEVGFDSRTPTFWILEGLFGYMNKESIVALLEQIDEISAPQSQLWADMLNSAMKERLQVGETDANAQRQGMWNTVQYGETDPLHGAMTALKWPLTLQADMSVEGKYFGRQWKPFTNAGASLFMMMATKPSPGA